jgi:hypothetical protein
MQNSKKILTFKEPVCLETFAFSLRDVTQYRFEFSVVDSSLIGQPEERSGTLYGRLFVGITIELNLNWRLKDEELLKVLFEYGKRHVIQKIKDGTLSDREELLLTTSNSPEDCPFDPSRIPHPSGAKFEVEVGEEKIMENPEFLQLASSIIDTRDNINAIFHQKHKEKLIELKEERDILQFFRDASSQEEFSFRVCALRNAATNLNIRILREITGITDSQIGSIGLLENYVQQYDNYDDSMIKTLRHINRFRHGYPIHGDRVEGVLEAHEYFGLDYPVEDFSSAWRTLLLNYLDALQKLFELITRLLQRLVSAKNVNNSR